MQLLTNEEYNRFAKAESEVMDQMVDLRQQALNLPHHAIRLSVSDRNCFRSVERLSAGGYVVNCVKNLCTVVSAAANFANLNIHIFEDDETVLVLKGLALYPLGPNGSFAVFAFVVIHSSFEDRLRPFLR
jgi:hypothetical protein